MVDLILPTRFNTPELLIPGRKPGTSTSEIIGMVDESQNRRNLAALSDESISSAAA